MNTLKLSKWVDSSCEKLFIIINDLERYPVFLPGCRAVTILEKTDNTMTATLTVGKGPIEHQFTTYNTLTKPYQTKMQLIKGPFKSLHGLWLLQPQDGGCLVSFQLDVVFKNFLIDATLKPLIFELADTMMNQFTAQAEEHHEY